MIPGKPDNIYSFECRWIEKKAGRSPEQHRYLSPVRVTGDSMVPTINPGEAVLIDTWESDRVELRNSKTCLVRLPDGSISVKRVALIERHHKPRLLYQSDNPICEPFEFNVEPERTIQWYILGRVRRAGREID